VKKFINAPDAVVREALAGVAAAHPTSRSTSKIKLWYAVTRPDRAR
jgi:dihydroxyacetone kinase